MKTIAEINEKIRKGKAVVVSAEEMPDIVDKKGARKAAEEVDVVTTGTFGAMCSSGAFLNFGHSDPPIKMQKVWLNDVEAYTGIAAVDAYIGATELSRERGIEYGGAHVIEDLVSGREVSLKASAYSTDCYPRTSIETSVRLEDLNQAFLFNPRNCYQRYNAATNSSDGVLHTYMGTLLPGKRNVNFSGTGELSPLINDPEYDVVGFGTRIFLGGGQGYVVGEGTQHNPLKKFATLSVKGNLRGMSPEYLKAGVVRDYGTTLYVGIGIPIPVLNEKIAKNTAVRNKDVKVNILDYSVPRLNRPVIREVDYETLFSGEVDVDGVKARTSSLSSRKVARDIAAKLGDWIEQGEFYLSEKLESLPADTAFKPMRMSAEVAPISRVMTRDVVTAKEDDPVEKVCNRMIKNGIDQIPVVSEEGAIRGIVTAWDITKATATGKRKLGEIMTSKVITASPDEAVDAVSRKLEKYKINATPVIDAKGVVVGIVTLSDINKFYRRAR
ncbi:MAG: homocysteine biosynthesis protein [Candidatus Altiarchaeota archaeon]|nr:homocysteine biosynthesis protein [Candidatus Altiarchaeota archaeon]